MFHIPPQQIPPDIDPHLFALLPQALPALRPNPLNSRPPTDLHAPAALARIDGAVPPGHARDCLHAAIHLLAGDLDRAHGLCQNVPTRHGAAWHAVMHRLEGDYWNSNYWWRRAAGLAWDHLADARHGILRAAPPAFAAALAPLGRQYDPSALVSLVERHGDEPGAVPTLLDLQRWEWAALFLDTFAAARP
jgi:hypothetical protein